MQFLEFVSGCWVDIQILGRLGFVNLEVFFVFVKGKGVRLFEQIYLWLVFFFIRVLVIEKAMSEEALRLRIFRKRKEV